MQLSRNNLLHAITHMPFLQTNFMSSAQSFYGTGISLFQFPTMCNEGISQAPININSTKKLIKLPDSYTDVLAVVLKKESVAVTFSAINS